MFHDIWELQKLQKAKVTFKVIQGHWATYDFLLVFHCNYVSILHLFPNIIILFLKIT